MVSKLNSDRKAGEGAGQAVSRIYGKIGFAGLWNGLPVRIFMIGTLTAFQWLIYDSFKVYLGVSLIPIVYWISMANLVCSCQQLVVTKCCDLSYNFWFPQIPALKTRLIVLIQC